ncbi:MAG: PD-(D/E)XK nuclease family protein [Rickettsiales bacterium]|nr:PD-(D/E)XK nuclease family protein [Rickettsiales bacterium]
MNILNIPSQYNFLESLFDWLLKNFPNNIADVKIFLPSTRSCREFRQIFLKNNYGQSVILPKIKAISDLSYEDFFEFLSDEEVKEIIDELLEIKVISDIDHLFFLSHEIRKTNIFNNLSLSQSLNIALQLKNLFDEIEKDEVDLDILKEIDDSDLSLHRQVTLEFLKNFHVHIKNSLIKKNIFFATSYQNFVTKKFIELLAKRGTKFPLIIAGSTGSVSAGRKLIKAISQQKNGFVVFHSFDKNISKTLEKNHPQFLLQQLLEFIEVKNNQVLEIKNDQFQICSNERINFISNITLPYEETIKWQNISDFSLYDLEKNFKIITAKNYLEEARIIAVSLENAVLENKKCAVITNNSDLLQLLKNELLGLSLNFNDSRNISVKDSKLINFILLLLNLIKSDFGSYELLAILKNPLFKKVDRKIIEDFENNILRQERVCLGLQGIKEKLLSLNDENLNKFFTDFYDNLSTIINASDLSIAAYLELLSDTIEKLTNKKWHHLLEEEDAALEIFEFFEKLKSQNNFTIKKEETLAIFELLFSQISYFEKSDSSAKIQLLPSIEARLLNYDLVIVASLNEGDFPQIQTENWLGKKIRNDLGIDKDRQKIGQNAYDFCNYLCNSSVILSRSLIAANSTSLPSSFFLKFETLCKKLKVKLKYLEYAMETTEKHILIRSKANPALKYRPKKLAITDISKLINDPYSIYAKRVLFLRELQKIDFESGYVEFGNFIHRALEEFIKNPCEPEIFLKNADKIFDKYFISNQAKLIWLPKFENIFNNFVKEEELLKAKKNYVEVAIQTLIEDVVINGKIDRIVLNDDNSIEILDYKTGQVPTTKDVISGLEPQLTLAALMLFRSGHPEFQPCNSESHHCHPERSEGSHTIERDISLRISKRNSIAQHDNHNKKISSLKYIKLSATIGNETKIISKDSEEIEMLVVAAKEGLSKLIKYFKDEKNAYIAAPNLSNYKENEYSHFSRVNELE